MQLPPVVAQGYPRGICRQDLGDPVHEPAQDLAHVVLADQRPGEVDEHV